MGKNKQKHEVLGELGAFAREKIKKSRQGAKHAEVFGVRKNSKNEVLCDHCASAREKTTKLSPGRKVRKGVWGKNKINFEFVCGLCASAREKNQYNLAESQSTQRCLG